VSAAYAFPLLPNSEQTLMENFLSPVFQSATRIAHTAATVELESTRPTIADYGIAWIVVVVGGAAAAFLYLSFFPSRAGQPAPGAARWVRRVAQNKFYVDELYEFLIIRPVKFISFVFYRVVDALLIDTVAVRGVAWVTARVGSALRYVQTGDAQAYAAVMALALLGGVIYAIVRVF
jgi:NADH-quinone oxidoreductase subunit L